MVRCREGGWKGVTMEEVSGGRGPWRVIRKLYDEGMRGSLWLARGTFPAAGSQSSYSPFFPFPEAAPSMGRLS